MTDAYTAIFGGTEKKRPQPSQRASAQPAPKKSRTRSDPVDERVDERVPTCWLSGLRCPYGNLVDSCHIVDAVLCENDDYPAIYSPDNRIWLSKTLHAALDSRMLAILPDGTISTGLSETQLAAMGITRRSRLPPSTLNPRRIAYLKRRPNGYNEFMLQSQRQKAQRRDST